MPEPTPKKIVLQAGRHVICACGKTSNAPFCDGSHVGTDISPKIIDLEAETKIAWCMCRESGNMPMCDGTHTKCGPNAGS